MEGKLKRSYLAIFLMGIFTAYVFAQEQENLSVSISTTKKDPKPFTTAPDSTKDDIITIEEPNVKITFVENFDATSDAELVITGNRTVRVRKRKARGAIYHIHGVFIGGSGTGPGKTVTWDAYAQETIADGTLTLYDNLTGKSIWDDSNTNTPDPVIYCITDPNNSDKGEIRFKFTSAGTATYQWETSPALPTASSWKPKPDPGKEIITGKTEPVLLEDVNPGEYTLTVSGPGAFVRRIKFIECIVDLDIYNGGADLDWGNNTGSQGAIVSEAEEEAVGAYILVNWDDDDGDGTFSPTNTNPWISGLPVPDLSEVPSTSGGSITITDEDNLAKLVMNVKKGTVIPDEGTVKLKISSGKDKIKLWTASTKGKLIALDANGEKTWDLSNTIQKTDFSSLASNGIWIETIIPSVQERDIKISLSWDKIDLYSASVNATSVMINLGNALYRNLDSDALGTLRCHTALATSYQGNCTKSDFKNKEKYSITEAGEDASGNEGIFINPLTHITNFGSGRIFRGCSTNISSLQNNATGYRSRVQILTSADYLANRSSPAVGYCWNDMMECITPGITESVWQGTFSDIKNLRCDGLVECCYEMNWVMAWGESSGSTYGYDIKYWDASNKWYNLERHNDISDVKSPAWQESFWSTLQPVTQSGFADKIIDSTYPPFSGGDFNYTKYDYQGRFWNTTFKEQNLVYPTSLSPLP